MNLSKRLLAIAELIENGLVVFDVGSDHGLLPCYLVKEKNCPKAYAGDNKEGPLKRAKENIEKFQLQDSVIPVLGDGLKKVQPDVDAIVIAGMGYFTVEDILRGQDLSPYKYVVVQVNKDVNLLRQFISDNNYTIVDEKVVFDDFYYEIVVFNADYRAPYSPKEIKFGPILMKKGEDIFVEYLQNRLNKIEKIYNDSKSPELLAQIDDLVMLINDYRPH